MDRHKKIRHIGGVTGSIMISRVLGYARDMVIANFFGARAIADAFYVAYRIPNLLRRLLGEGALVAAFVPVYTDYLENKTQEERDKFLGTITTVLSIVLISLTILGIIIAPLLVRMIAPGFIGSPNKLRLAIILTRIMFPFLAAIGISALFMGILNARHIFIYSALSSCFLNISEIFFMLVICPFMPRPIQGLAIAVVVGGFLQALFQFIPIVKEKIRIVFRFDLKNEGFRKVVTLMLPATIAVSVDQISAFVDVICASWLREGSVSALYYSNHLMLLPLSLFGVAVATVSLPMLSRTVTSNDLEALKSQLLENLKLMIYFIIPSSIGLIILARPIIHLLFERGKFDAVATSMSSQALRYYSIGIIAYASVKIISTAFYSLKDTKTPVKIAAVAMILNVILNIILMQYLEVGGLALATAIASIVNATLLLIFLRKKIGSLGFSSLIGSILKIIFASVVMGLVCMYLNNYFYASKILAVFVPIILGAVIYFGLTYIFKVEESRYILKTLKR